MIFRWRVRHAFTPPAGQVRDYDFEVPHEVDLRFIDDPPPAGSSITDLEGIE